MNRVHRMPFGAAFEKNEVRFSLWAPTAKTVSIVIDDEAPRPMSIRDGWAEFWSAEAKPGTRYIFEIDGRLRVPDPASRAQMGGPLGASVVVDPAIFEWTDGDWRGRPWREAVIWEAHVGTATEQGTFAALETMLPHLSDSSVTMIELMPLSDCCGERNWGYDGVLPFAPNHSYGSPDDLKRFVVQAHRLGLSVMLDVVYNHFGPKGNFLSSYAGLFFNPKHKTPWGDAINFDGAHHRVVRDFFIHNALYWLQEYHLDGLRFDAVHAIMDDSERCFLSELSARIRDVVKDRPVHLVLENEKNEATRLDEKAQPSSFYTAQWNDDLHHCWHRLLTNEAESYYEDFDRPVARLGRALTEGFVYQGEPSKHKGGEPRGEPSAHLPPSAFVSFLQNHDQIGNRAYGERIGHLTEARRLALAQAGLLLSPQIPLIFMGEEWNASSPFLFFVDFSDDPALSQAVRDGRRQEFAHFAAFSHSEQIPDPTSQTTFQKSKLNWRELSQSRHAAALETFRSLLALRAAVVSPLLESRLESAAYTASETDVLDVRWIFKTSQLRFYANFGGHPTKTTLERRERPIWESEALSSTDDRSIAIASWAGFFSICER